MLVAPRYMYGKKNGIKINITTPRYIIKKEQKKRGGQVA